MGKGGDRGRGRLQRGAFTWLRAGGGGCQLVAGLVVVIAVHTVLTPHVGSTHQKGLNELATQRVEIQIQNQNRASTFQSEAVTADQRSNLRINPGF